MFVGPLSFSFIEDQQDAYDHHYSDNKDHK